MLKLEISADHGWGFRCGNAPTLSQKVFSFLWYHLNWEHRMTDDDQMDRKPPAPRMKIMSLYASSADYERRLSEDCTQAFEPDIVDETKRLVQSPRSPVSLGR
jgi:hypothetical protein